MIPLRFGNYSTRPQLDPATQDALALFFVIFIIAAFLYILYITRRNRDRDNIQ